MKVLTERKEEERGLLKPQQSRRRRGAGETSFLVCGPRCRRIQLLQTVVSTDVTDLCWTRQQGIFDLHGSNGATADACASKHPSASPVCGARTPLQPTSRIFISALTAWLPLHPAIIVEFLRAALKNCFLQDSPLLCW